MPNLAPLPYYLCRKILREIELTGKQDDPLWARAEPIQLNDAVTGMPGRYQTTVRLLYSEQFLYLAFGCEDEFCWGTITDHDGPIWLEECVEVFLNPASVSHQYYELNVSPRNVVFDACVVNNRTTEFPDRDFLPLASLNLAALKTAVWIDGELNQPNGVRSWSVEYAIPLADLWGAPHLPPTKGDVWRANFCRIDSPVKDQPESYSWSHLGEVRFHLPWRFGYLIFD